MRLRQLYRGLEDMLGEIDNAFVDSAPALLVVVACMAVLVRSRAEDIGLMSGMK